MARATRWALLALGALVVTGYASRNFIARRAIELAIRRQTGFPLRVGAAELRLLSGTLDLRDVELTNPPEFPERRFVRLPRFHVRYATASILRGAPHLRELAIDVDEVVVVTNERGEKNSTRLSANMAGGSTRKPRYRIDLLHVRVGSVVISEYGPRRHTRRTLALGTDRTYRNISESTNLSELMLGTVLHQAGSAVGDVGKGIGDALRNVGRDLGKIGGDARRREKQP